MAKFISLFKETVADLSLRPLLLAAGVAATAAVIHYYFNRDDGDKTAADAEDKTVLEDPSYDRTTEPALVRPTEVVQDQMIEPEMKIQKLAVSNHQLENRTREKKDIATELENRVREQEDRARELEDSVRELVDTTIELEDSVRELVDTTIELEDREKELEDRVRQLEDRVRELEDRARDKGDRARQLEDRERELDDRARDQEDTVIEMEDRARQVEDRARELEDREIELEDRLREQENRARELEDREIELEDREIELEDRLREQENRVRELENRERELEEREIELEDRVRDQEDTAIELEDTAIELENRERELEDRERELEDRARELEDRERELEDRARELEDRERELEDRERELEDRARELEDRARELEDRARELENRERELEDRARELEDRERELEDRERELEDRARELEDRARELEELLSESCSECDMRNFSLADDEERHQKVIQTITELMEEKNNLEHQVETLTHMVEDSEKKIYDTCLQWRKRENGSLAQAEERHQKTVENISQLEKEKCKLRKQVTTMRDTVTDLGYKLYEAHLHRDKLINRRETERQAHRILQVENDELKTALMHKEELLKVSLSEAEEKHQKAVENIIQLEEEKSDMTNQVETLRDTIQDMEDMFYEAQEQCDEIISERQAHRILQVENDELKTTLMHKEELLKGSLAQAEERHQKTVENISQLEKEKCKLRKQVTTMRDTVTDLGYKLYEAHLHRDKLINRRETERQAHRILQVENDELKTALMHKEELLKVSLSEAEEKHQKAVENIIQLEEEKSDMTNQVETLRDTIQDICKPGKSSGTKETTNTETESSLNRSGSSSESV